MADSKSSLASNCWSGSHPRVLFKEEGPNPDPFKHRSLFPANGYYKKNRFYLVFTLRSVSSQRSQISSTPSRRSSRFLLLQVISLTPQTSTFSTQISVRFPPKWSSLPEILFRYSFPDRFR